MPDPFYVLAGWLIDGSGGPILQNIRMEVNGGMIVSIKGAGDPDLNEGDVIDFSNCTVLPGLVDVHVHLFMSGSDDTEVRQHQLSAAYEDLKGVISRHIQKQLAQGVIALRDGGDYGGYVLRYKKEYLPSEDLPICLKSAGKAWRATGRYGRLIGRPPSGGHTLAQAIKHETGAVDHIKIVNSGLNSLTEFGKETPPQFNLDQLKAAVRAAGELGLRVMVHANGEVPVRLAIEAGCHSIEHGFFMGRDNLRRMADKEVTWVPTAYTMKAYHESIGAKRLEREVSMKNLDHQMDQISWAIQYGVRVALGTDCGSLGVHHGSSFREELGLLILAGMPLEKAIQSATLNGAKTLGTEKDFGRLDNGMHATFIAVKGAPPKLPETLNTPVKIFIRGKAWGSDHNGGYLR